MSWQAYIDQSLLGTGVIDKAAIFSKNPEPVQPWAQSKGFDLSNEEVKAICNSFANSDKLFETGFRVAGAKYFVIRADDKVLQGRKGEEGVICHKTKLAVIVAHYPAGQQAGEANKVVLALGDYLIGVGY